MHFRVLYVHIYTLKTFAEIKASASPFPTLKSIIVCCLLAARLTALLESEMLLIQRDNLFL